MLEVQISLSTIFREIFEIELVMGISLWIIGLENRLLPPKSLLETWVEATKKSANYH